MQYEHTCGFLFGYQYWSCMPMLMGMFVLLASVRYICIYVRVGRVGVWLPCCWTPSPKPRFICRQKYEQSHASKTCLHPHNQISVCNTHLNPDPNTSRICSANPNLELNTTLTQLYIQFYIRVINRRLFITLTQSENFKYLLTWTWISAWFNSCP